MIGTMPRPRPPYLHHERTRHGAFVWYVRREHGPRIRLKSEFNSPEFWSEYRAALEGAPAPTKTSQPKPHSLAWAINKYRFSNAWASLSSATRRQRDNIYRGVIEAAGSERLADITEAVIRAGRERRATKPHSANNFLKAMRGFFAWAIEEQLVSIDPTKGVKLLKGRNDDVGFHTWTEEEVARFEARWPLGTRERLAFDIFMYTGLRRGDAVKLGRQHIRDGVMAIRTEKGDEPITLPILPPLAESIAAVKTGDLTLIVTERGQPFSKESFGNWFREACQKAGCPGSAHGLRKAGASRAAEAGATERQLMALFGWTSGKMPTHYTRAADRKRLAMEAAELLMPARTKNKNRPHLGSGKGRTVKTPKILGG